MGRREPLLARDQGGLVSSALVASARVLQAESDRWFLWLPVLFAGGILSYFALSVEPEPRVAAALVIAAIGLCFATRAAPLGFALGGAFLAFAQGFATAKLRTEMVRAPLLTKELRYVAVTGFVEEHELRHKGRARIVLRVISVGDLKPNERPYRVRMACLPRTEALPGPARPYRCAPLSNRRQSPSSRAASISPVKPGSLALALSVTRRARLNL
jgi:competence protein ComEC